MFDPDSWSQPLSASCRTTMAVASVSNYSFTFTARSCHIHLGVIVIAECMATHESGEQTFRGDMFQSLAAVLQANRAGVHGDKMAENVLRFADGRELIGITSQATRALYREPATRSLIGVRFDKNGVFAGQQLLFEQDVRNPAAWVTAHADELLWTNPRLPD